MFCSFLFPGTLPKEPAEVQSEPEASKTVDEQPPEKVHALFFCCFVCIGFDLYFMCFFKPYFSSSVNFFPRV